MKEERGAVFPIFRGRHDISGKISGVAPQRRQPPIKLRCGVHCTQKDIIVLILTITHISCFDRTK